MSEHTPPRGRVLSDTDAAEIRRRYWWGKDSLSSLAREMGVSPETARNVAFNRGAYANSKAVS